VRLKGEDKPEGELDRDVDKDCLDLWKLVDVGLSGRDMGLNGLSGTTSRAVLGEERKSMYDPSEQPASKSKVCDVFSWEFESPEAQEAIQVIVQSGGELSIS